MKRALLVLLCVGAAGQISSPQIGFVRDLAGALRPVFGVAGAFTLGEPVLGGVLAAASSGDTAVAVTSSQVVVITGQKVVWRGSAPPSATEAIGFVSQRPRWVRFANGSCLVWPDSSTKAEPQMASFCPSAPPRPETLKSRLPDGVGGEPEPLAPGWVVLRAPNRLYLARLGPEEAVYELPEVSQ